MSGLLSISGLASGLDVDSIIEQIMEFEARPIARLQQRIAVQEKTLTGFENFEAALLSMRSGFSRLSNAISFKGKTAVSSNADVLSATAGTGAAAGTFTLTVERLAQSHQIVSQGFATKTADIGTGTFSLTVGDRSRVEIAVDTSNNTLQGLAEAINQADAGASASIVNTGEAESPYVLLITGEDTGSNERIVLEVGLSGGTAPAFGSVGSVVEGAKTGTATVSSSGHYTGDSDATLTYAVTSGGTVGVDDIVIEYTDGNGLSGSFTVAVGYVPGEKVDVFGGVALSFSAGTLDTGDAFSTDVETSSVQAPLDARFTLGNTLGGASGITVSSATNTVTDVIDGVTFELHQVSANPVTVTVDHDLAAVETDVRAMVEGYNSLVDLMGELFYFDLETGEKGVLLGDRVTIDLYNEVQSMLTTVAEGVTGGLESLGDVGLTVSGEGKLIVDSGRLTEALEDDLDAVMELFATAGRTTDADIRFLTASDKTTAYSLDNPFPQGYEVVITQAAERAVVAGAQIAEPSQAAPIVIDDGNNALRLKVGNTSTGDLLIAEGVYQSGDALAEEIQAKIDASGEVPAGAVSVRYVDDGGGSGHFELVSRDYGSATSVEVETTLADSIYAAIGFTAGAAANGRDVEGTINGQAAEGNGRYLTGSEGNEYAEGLRLMVTITPDELTVQGADQGTVMVTKGVASKMSELIARITDLETGDAVEKKNAIADGIEILQDRIDGMTERMEQRRERLIAEFLQLESVLSELQGQQEYLNQAIQNLSNLSARSKR